MWGLESIPSPGWQIVYGNSPCAGDMPYWSVSISQTPAFLLAALRVSPWAFLPQHKDQEAEGGVSMYHSTPHGPGPSWSWLGAHPGWVSSYRWPPLACAPNPGRTEAMGVCPCPARHVGGWGCATCLGVGAEDTSAGPAVRAEPHVSLCDMSCSVLGSWRGVPKAVFIWHSKPRAKVLSGPCFQLS